jgi:radical SAM enzyme (TIGR01210 family)
MQPYPAAAVDRDRFVLDRRAPRPVHDPWRHQSLVVEDERTADGDVVRAGTVFLTGRECPWRCAMCDLWQYTIATDTPRGAIPAQISSARRAFGDDPVRHVKLYNAGSFFDPRAVPDDDYDEIATALTGLDRVIVESHPALIGPRLNRLLEALDRHPGSGTAPAALEVAMGLETAHPGALERLHKRMTVDAFSGAAARLGARGVSLRVFLLISPPFVPDEDQDEWLLRSLDAAFSSGASVVSLVPTRPGNGALEALAEQGMFRQPSLGDIERSVDAAHAHAAGRGRVFVDLWDFERFADCERCHSARRARLHAMNLEQRVVPIPCCDACGSSGRRLGAAAAGAWRRP